MQNAVATFKFPTNTALSSLKNTNTKIQKTGFRFTKTSFLFLNSERGYSILGATEGDGLSLEQIFSRKLCGSQN